MALTGCSCPVKVEDMPSDKFLVTSGSREGDPLSPTVINLALGYRTPTVRTNLNGTLYNETQQQVTYADDVMLTVR